jgi:uncharacterized Zn-binding protein involved in type VI secretion
MPGIQRIGDANSAGGVITGGGIGSVRIEGRIVSVEGDSVSPHPCCGQRGCPPIHCNANTRSTSVREFRAGNKKIILTGDLDTCGHPRAGGAATVRFG